MNSLPRKRVDISSRIVEYSLAEQGLLKNSEFCHSERSEAISSKTECDRRVRDRHVATLLSMIDLNKVAEFFNKLNSESFRLQWR